MSRLITSALLIAAATAACAGNYHPLANYFGNTLYVTTEARQEHAVYYYPDNTFEVRYPDSRYHGTYTLAGDKICLTAIRPGDTQASTNCRGFDVSRRPGERWSEATPGGVTHLRLEAGHPNTP